MRRSLGGFAASVALLAGTSSVAAPLFDMFQGECVKTGSAPKSVAAHAEANGWVPMPEAMLGSLAKDFADGDFKAKELRAWIRSDQKVLNMLLTARAELPVKIKGTAFLCAVASLPPDPTTGGLLAKWAAVPPVSNEMFGKGVVAYGFSLKPDGGHKEFAMSKLTSDAAALAALSDPGARIVAVQSDSQMTMLLQFSLENEL